MNEPVDEAVDKPGGKPGDKPGERPGISPERRRRFAISMLFLVVLVNMPLATSLTNSARLAASGTEVTAEVLQTARSEEDDAFLIVFRFDESDVPEATDEELVWTAPVPRSVLEQAEDEGSVEVRVLQSKPSVHRVEGELRSRAGLVTTLAVDVVVIGIALIWWRARRLSADADSEDEPDNERDGNQPA